MAILILGLLAPPLMVAHAEEAEKTGQQEVDTEFIFGFTAGADVGELGEKEIEHQTIARFGRMQQGAEFSLPGLLVSVLAIPVMYFLSQRKLQIARELGSRALRADAIESITCGWLALVVVAALVAQLLVGAWWVDALASLAIVWFLIREGREAWEGKECCKHGEGLDNPRAIVVAGGHCAGVRRCSRNPPQAGPTADGDYGLIRPPAAALIAASVRVAAPSLTRALSM